MNKKIEISVDEEVSNECEKENIETGDKSADDLKARIAECEKKSEQYLDMLQRMRAEFDNYKKRTEKEKRTFFEEGKIQTLIPMLGVVDNMSKALYHLSGTEDTGSSMKEGLDLIYKQVLDFLAKEGIKRIETVGKRFDPEMHEAVATEKNENVEDGIVIEELQAGYMLNSRLLRPSKVIVSVHV